MIIDTHAHYDDSAFDNDRDELLTAISKSNISNIINPGCNIESSKKAQHLSHIYDFIYFAAGIHPEDVNNLPSNWLDQISNIVTDNKCVAIGEIGLDYYWVQNNKELQKEIFIKQLELAEHINKPVIIHDREAHGDSLEIIKKHSIKGVFHCFSGSVEMAKELINLGWYLGFDGPITYKNAKKSIDVLQFCPLDRLLIETDSPYLSPVPLRGTRNDSRSLTYVIEKISSLKEITIDEVINITNNNAKALFSIN